MGDGSQSFKERNSTPYNKGEELFKAYCHRVGATYWQIGFDEKRSIPGYYHLAPFLRHLPDFVVHNPNTGKTVVVEVKGTLNYKQADRNRLEAYANTYGTESAPYLVVFCMGNKVIWRTAKEVMDAYDWSTTIGQWTDGKRYRTLDI